MKFLKHSIALLFFLLGLSLPLVSHADEEEVETLEVNGCGGDYYAFLATVRSENTRAQGMKDFFTLPYCQLYDIMELDEELDELRDAFRSASFNCEDTSAYEEQYHEILMEQYFVRNVQKSKSDVINTKDAEEFEEKQQELLDRLYEEMYLAFVIDEDRVSETTFDEYFTNWSAKYDDRIGDYNHCEEGPWAELTETWTDFVETISELSIDIDQPEKRSFKDIAVPETEVDVDEDMSSMGKSVLNAWEYVKNLANKEKVDIEAPLTLENLPEDEPTTFENIFGVLNVSSEIYTIETNAADRMAKYKLLYGYGGAVATTDMQSILTELNRILEESNTKDFPNIQSAAAKIYDKQCN